MAGYNFEYAPILKNKKVKGFKVENLVKKLNFEDNFILSTTTKRFL